MICKYCGSEIDNSLKQCSECGMPTENFKVPVPAPVKTKKKKKKIIDPDKIPANTPAVLGAIVAIISIVSIIVGAIFAGCSLGFFNLYWQQGLLAIFNIFRMIFLVGAAFFIAIALLLAIVGGILSIVGKKNKKLNQSTPLVSACFSLLAIVSSIATLILFLIYVVFASAPTL